MAITITVFCNSFASILKSPISNTTNIILKVGELKQDVLSTLHRLLFNIVMVRLIMLFRYV